MNMRKVEVSELRLLERFRGELTAAARAEDAKRFFCALDDIAILAAAGGSTEVRRSAYDAIERIGFGYLADEAIHDMHGDPRITINRRGPPQVALRA